MSATPAQAHASPRSHQATPIDRRYSLRFAGTREEVEAALRLRFEVFNLELHRGSRNPFSPAWAKMNSIAFDGALNALGDVVEVGSATPAGPTMEQMRRALNRTDRTSDGVASLARKVMQSALESNLACGPT